MKNNVTFSIGNIALIDKINGKFGLFDKLFGNVRLKARTFKESAKFLVANRLGICTSLNQVHNFYPEEFFHHLGYKNVPSERTLNRDLDRIGKHSEFILENYMQFIYENDLVSDKQFMDFSSSYFEGNKCALGNLGYSRDHQPGKNQITWGISTGMNGIPTALTIQKGNVQDKKHFNFMLKTCSKILKKGSLLIYDCGGNTKENNSEVLKLGFNFLTLKAKKKTIYKKFISIYETNEKTLFNINDTIYKCVKFCENNTFYYIYFSNKLELNQKINHTKKFEKELKKNDSKLKKVKSGKNIGEYFSREGTIIAKGELQEDEIVNPYINGIEGYFVLESSVDEDAEKILNLYKNRDKAEKLIRNMKEGTELRPIRHWSDNAVKGHLLIIFLTNCIINLTHLLNNVSVAKNLKLLKKSLNNLTLTVVYPKNSFRFTILSNISEEIRLILGDFINKYIDKTLEMRW
jgi:transposase